MKMFIQDEDTIFVWVALRGGGTEGRDGICEGDRCVKCKIT